MSSNSTNTKYPTYVTYDSSPTTNTTYVQADPSNFRSVVQKLTGSSFPATSSQGSASPRPSSDVSLYQSTASFKLHERRQQGAMTMRKLEMIKLNNHHGPTSVLSRPRRGNEVGAIVSPVSTLDGLGLGLGSPNPRTPISSMSEEEERAVIAEKGFFLHPVSPFRTTRDYEPQLLPLFPLHSPKGYHD